MMSGLLGLRFYSLPFLINTLIPASSTKSLQNILPRISPSASHTSPQPCSTQYRSNTIHTSCSTSVINASITSSSFILTSASTSAIPTYQPTSSPLAASFSTKSNVCHRRLLSSTSTTSPSSSSSVSVTSSHHPADKNQTNTKRTYLNDPNINITTNIKRSIRLKQYGTKGEKDYKLYFESVTPPFSCPDSYHDFSSNSHPKITNCSIYTSCFITSKSEPSISSDSTSQNSSSSTSNLNSRPTNSTLYNLASNSQPSEVSSLISPWHDIPLFSCWNSLPLLQQTVEDSSSISFKEGAGEILSEGWTEEECLRREGKRYDISGDENIQTNIKHRHPSSSLMENASKGIGNLDNQNSVYIDVEGKDAAFEALNVNMIVEIPKYTKSKMEILTTGEYNPIQQDMKNNLPRYYHGPIYWNYGALPQTWECPFTPGDFNVMFARGDNDPVDVVEIGGRQMKTGDIVTVKVLGALALIDGDELDWKFIAVNIGDQFYSNINTLEDINKYYPGTLSGIREWFRWYKTPDGKAVNKFGYNETIVGRKAAIDVLVDSHKKWFKLTTGGTDKNGLWVPKSV